MRAPQNGRHLTDDHFTKEDVAEFHRLMGELLSTCRAIGEQYAPEGAWAPSTPGLLEQFGESMQVIADISRPVNKTRAGLRRIAGRARQRLYEDGTGRAGLSR
ncbi:hypothetical protein GCM10010503_41940 [Streptomyces lucensis JCM 4490]|uniref:Uncharacterized protein n=1 Tax=Streptomyces lucensis JCM 4490 TaxID=1306176 RepID=A0A918J8E6_9ACTN|nr:hypothetical protein [Streptomyces lucensis]GGW60269.1 hypothetical protein GCM10010503_41940 [Streptomyces lucensis JCM 4490]